MTISQYIAAGLNLLTSVVAARMLGPEDYGLVAMIMAYPSLIYTFTAVKTVSVTVRYIAQYRVQNEHEQLLSIVKLGYALDLLVSIICLLLVGVSAWWVSQYIYQVSDLSWMMISFTCSYPFYSLFGSSRAVLSSFRKFNILSLLNLIGSIFKLALVACSLLLGFGVAGMIFAIALQQATIGITAVFVATRLLNREGFGYWWMSSWTRLRFVRTELTQFFGWNYIYLTLTGVVEQVPIILLGWMLGSQEAGYYRLAANIATIGSYLEGALSNVTYPILSSRLESHENLVLMMRKWTWRVGLPASLLPLFLIPLLPWIVPLAFSPTYQPAVQGIQLMMGEAVVSTLLFWLQGYYYASGRLSLWVTMYAVFTISLISLGWLGISIYGFTGIVLVYVFLTIIIKVFLTTLVISRRK